MSHLFATLLATDDLAQRTGCGLKPELRSAMEASLRFPAKAASPMDHGPLVLDPSDPSVVRLPVKSPHGAKTDMEQKA
ncbi:hypothetical protein [Shimia marina]|uniref:Uncharacterized protein n=1 Tax=Shimia marina TaxID=321267 RepID=A0A0N7LSK2_9RHOB|nr:hypothetical protein [Shimia marina]CUH53852.1 hypothetical protein SHM7688_03321 [Shimia marina]SFE21229.1 hypothetical protein SAMN04488037_106190 [Shimia marina]